MIQWNKLLTSKNVYLYDQHFSLPMQGRKKKLFKEGINKMFFEGWGEENVSPVIVNLFFEYKWILFK